MSVVFHSARESNHRVEFRGTTRGQIAGEQGYECEKQRNGDKGTRIYCLHGSLDFGRAHVAKVGRRASNHKSTTLHHPAVSEVPARTRQLCMIARSTARI